MSKRYLTQPNSCSNLPAFSINPAAEQLTGRVAKYCRATSCQKFNDAPISPNMKMPRGAAVRDDDSSAPTEKNMPPIICKKSRKTEFLNVPMPKAMAPRDDDAAPRPSRPTDTDVGERKPNRPRPPRPPISSLIGAEACPIDNFTITFGKLEDRGNASGAQIGKRAYRSRINGITSGGWECACDNIVKSAKYRDTKLTGFDQKFYVRNGECRNEDYGEWLYFYAETDESRITTVEIETDKVNCEYVAGPKGAFGTINRVRKFSIRQGGADHQFTDSELTEIKKMNLAIDGATATVGDATKVENGWGHCYAIFSRPSPRCVLGIDKVAKGEFWRYLIDREWQNVHYRVALNWPWGTPLDDAGKLAWISANLASLTLKGFFDEDVTPTADKKDTGHIFYKARAKDYPAPVLKAPEFETCLAEGTRYKVAVHFDAKLTMSGHDYYEDGKKVTDHDEFALKKMMSNAKFQITIDGAGPFMATSYWRSPSPGTGIDHLIYFDVDVKSALCMTKVKQMIESRCKLNDAGEYYGTLRSEVLFPHGSTLTIDEKLRKCRELEYIVDGNTYTQHVACEAEDPNDPNSRIFITADDPSGGNCNAINPWLLGSVAFVASGIFMFTGLKIGGFWPVVGAIIGVVIVIIVAWMMYIFSTPEAKTSLNPWWMIMIGMV